MQKYTNEVYMGFGFYGLRRVGRFINRLYRWIPLLWNQEEWDYEYIYDVLELKLKELQKCIADDDIHRDAPIYYRQITICLKYLDRFRNSDNYIEVPYNEASFEDGIFKSSENFSKACRKLHNFEDDSFNKFWKRFVQWHQGWWV